MMNNIHAYEKYIEILFGHNINMDMIFSELLWLWTYYDYMF